MKLKKINLEKIKQITPKSVWLKIKSWVMFGLSNFIFIVLLYLYVLRGFARVLLAGKLTGKLFGLLKFEMVEKGLDRAIVLIDKKKDDDVAKDYLIKLAFANMMSKKNRSIVTIGGVALGVGAIVFLVSLGYGLEKMVISKVARLDELRMADVSLSSAASLKMNDEIIGKIKEFEGVEEVVPLVSMVSKVRYNNSILDVRSFGVNRRYLDAVGAKLVIGDEFEDKDADFSYVMDEGQVAGVSQEVVWTQWGEKVVEGIFDFNVMENEKVMVFEECSMESDLLGFVLRIEGGYLGEEIWGERYRGWSGEYQVGKDVYMDKLYSAWVRTKVPLWQVDEEGLAVPYLDSEGRVKWAKGCLTKEDLLVDYESVVHYSDMRLDEYLENEEEERMGEVLGIEDEASASAEVATADEATASALTMEEATTSAGLADEFLYEEVVATDSAGVEWVELRRIGESQEEEEKLDFVGQPVAEAYISSNMLKLFGKSAGEVLGESFWVTYIVPEGLVAEVVGRSESVEVEYKIKGVMEDESSSFYYFQLADAKRLGVVSYSQLKVIMDDESKLGEVRKLVETLGFKTASTVDTVVEIEKLFRTLRMLLGFLGTIALAVASLGMFNTMTVSLLERTREVGVMKAMGMLSDEVRELFLAESMIMGVGGGTVGVFFGWSMGKTLSLILTSISMVKGQGMIDISYIPFFFVAFIMMVSFLVGVATGWYPSKRARAISALNALRYE